LNDVDDIQLVLLCLVQAYDQHLNMILGDVEETVTTVVIDDETYEEIYKVYLISPPENNSFRKDFYFTHDVFFCQPPDLRDAYSDRLEILHNGQY